MIMQKIVFIAIEFYSKDKGIYFGISRMQWGVIFHKVDKEFPPFCNKDTVVSISRHYCCLTANEQLPAEEVNYSNKCLLLFNVKMDLCAI
jgi:hypothetical protein